MNWEIFWNHVMLIGVIALLFSAGFLFSEVRNAHNFCAKQNGSYGFDFLHLQHTCNGKSISVYKLDNKTYWDFDSNHNWNFTVPTNS